MNDISDNAIMTALGRRMTAAVATQTVAASNLANLDTPGYRAREVTFDDALTRELQKSGLAVPAGREVTMVSTNPGHLGGGVALGPQVTESSAPAQARRDGNNVEVDRELLQMTRAAGDFAEAQTVLAAKFRLIRYAIEEGR